MTLNKRPRLFGPTARLLGLVVLSLGLAAPSFAQNESEAAPAAPASADPAAFTLELNAVEPQDAACRLTFVAENGRDTALGGIGFEMVFFNDSGLVDRMTVFDFGAMPEGKTLVKRFDVPQTECGSISRILVNAVSRCEGDGADAAACMASLRTENRTETAFGQ